MIDDSDDDQDDDDDDSLRTHPLPLASSLIICGAQN